ncbi:Metallo-dependent phosphatase-like protein [Dimargaris cristalligena]|uniref:Metallo-dependent phosphatase-like protein n=1 Tax=Dimargaris cristalligena TaxID=215637 RepID=A0A4P9ZW54_9FUNG|nr:Metallo-dependent phosphatase-like protein [Dimargaris cristalligena]|eukprot:RKP37865.1 Metallo-dependent phosphatase-like protein [Dimargaris cristalligena]
MGSTGSLNSVGSTPGKISKWKSYPKENHGPTYYSRRTGIRLFPPQYDYSSLVKFEKLTDTSKRYIIVGDVHGQLTDLKALLEEMKFDRKWDQVILAGDLVAKGEDSLGVLKLAREIGAKCIRGNYEDFIFLILKEIPQNRPSRDWKNELTILAGTLTKEDSDYLDGYRLVYQLPDINNEKVLVVHAGMDASKPINDQDPAFAMYVPYLCSTTRFNGYEDYHGVWQDQWASHQRQDGTIVIYSHEEKREPVIGTWSKGIDTTCYKGG